LLKPWHQGSDCAPHSSSQVMAATDKQQLLAEMLAEKLESSGLSDEVLEVMVKKEGVCLGRIPDSQDGELPSNVRLLAFCYLQRCVYNDSCGPTCFINAVQLFDLSSKRVIGSELSTGSVLALAAAVWMVSFKMNATKDCLEYQVDQLAALAELLVGCPAATCKDIRQKEKALIHGFNLSQPTPSTWYSLFSARLDVILNGILQEGGHLARLESAAWNIVTLALQSMQVSQRKPPYIIALGSFCLALAVAGLVPVGDVVDTSIPGIAVQTPETANIDVMLRWLMQKLGTSDGAVSPVPPQAVFAAAEKAVLSKPQSMRFAATVLAAQVQFAPSIRQAHLSSSVV